MSEEEVIEFIDAVLSIDINTKWNFVSIKRQQSCLQYDNASINDLLNIINDIKNNVYYITAKKIEYEPQDYDHNDFYDFYDEVKERHYRYWTSDEIKFDISLENVEFVMYRKDKIHLTSIANILMIGEREIEKKEIDVLVRILKEKVKCKMNKNMINSSQENEI